MNSFNSSFDDRGVSEFYEQFLSELQRSAKNENIKMSPYVYNLLRASVPAWFEETAAQWEVDDRDKMAEVGLTIFRRALSHPMVKKEQERRGVVGYSVLFYVTANEARLVAIEIGFCREEEFDDS
jgi:hypothetical protein